MVGLGASQISKIPKTFPGLPQSNWLVILSNKAIWEEEKLAPWTSFYHFTTEFLKLNNLSFHDNSAHCRCFSKLTKRCLRAALEMTYLDILGARAPTVPSTWPFLVHVSPTATSFCPLPSLRQQGSHLPKLNTSETKVKAGVAWGTQRPQMEGKCPAVRTSSISLPSSMRLKSLPKIKSLLLGM